MDKYHDLWLVPLICPDCGNQLPAEEDDVVYWCSRCRTGWELAGDAPARREIVPLAGAGGLHLPFWLFPFRLTSREGEVKSVADFLPLTGAVRLPRPDEQTAPPLLFVPSFAGLLLPQVLRGGRLMTLRMPSLKRAAAVPATIAPVVFNERDGARMAEAILLATITEERKKSPQFLKTLSLKLGAGRLCTIPFLRQGEKYWQPELNLEL